MRNKEITDFYNKMKSVLMSTVKNGKKHIANIELEKFFNKDNKQNKFIYMSVAGVLVTTLAISGIAASLNKEGGEVSGMSIPPQNAIASLQSVLGDEDIEQPTSKEIVAYGIMVDGNMVVALRTKEEAEEVLTKVKEPFMPQSEDSSIEEISFLENIEIVEMNIDYDKVVEVEDGVKLIAKGTLEERTHIVEKGENPWLIAKTYNITEEDIIKANPGLNPKTIQIGQKLSLVVPKPHVNVVTKERAVLAESIPNETITKTSAKIYRGETRVEQAGKAGLKEIEAIIYRQNGVEIKEKREIVKEKVVRQPVDRIVVAGTLAPPPKIGTGSFSMPSRGSISSPFGMRWGIRHNGIDIAAPHGSDVRAADGGKVIFSGYRGSFGNLIIIDHGDGFETYYAHNSANLVKTGDKVHKDELIARIGTTGVSTGPHVHFEIRKFGVPVNPQNYLK